MTEPPPTRPSLLVRLRDARDAQAWAQFVQVYAPLVYGFARRQGLQDADAADLTQEVLHTVARSISRLDYDPRRGSFRGWLFTVVRTRLSNFRDRWRTHPDRGSGDTDQVEIRRVCFCMKAGVESGVASLRMAPNRELFARLDVR